MTILPTTHVRDVFICYASPDVAVAQTICATLEANRIACWMAPRDIRPGEKYGEAIIQAIKTCRVMVFVFSSRSNSSEHTVREIERAVNYKLIIIPFRIENVTPSKELEYFLCAPQWLNAMGKEFQQQLPALVANVSQQLRKSRNAEFARKGLPPPPPSKPSEPIQLEKPGGTRLLPWVLAGGFGAILVIAIIVFAVIAFSSKHKTSSSTSTSVPKATQTTVQSPPVEQATLTAQTLANRGIQRMRLKDFRGATDEFTAAIRLMPQSAKLYAFRAQSFSQRKDSNASIADWTKFIELEPGSHEGYSARGQEYLRKSDYERALTDFLKVVQLEPNTWLGYELLGDASRKKGDHKKTIEYYLEDLRLGPPDPAALYFYMGEAAAQMGDADMAEGYRKKAKSLDANVAQRLSAR